jgi:hypothetical protein
MSRKIRSAGNGYCLTFCAIPGTGNFAPADATDYFIGGVFPVTPQTVGGLVRVYVPKAGTVKRVRVTIVNAATNATAETSTMYLRLNNTTDYTIQSGIDVSGSTPVVTVATNSSMSIAVDDDDYLEIKWTTPTWVTNPGAIRISGNVYIE